MFINISLKKELLYILFFIPIYFIVFYDIEFLNIKDSNLKEYIDKSSKFLMFIFYFYENNTIKKAESSNLKLRRKKKNKKFIKSNAKEEKRKMKIIFSIILISIIFEIFNSILNFFIKQLPNNILQYSENLVILLVDLIFFKPKFYNHYLVATFINVILFLIILIYSFSSIDKPLLTLIFLILINYSYAFSRLLLNFVNSKYYINIYLLGSLIGFVQICFTIIKKLIFKETLTIHNENYIYILILKFFGYFLLHFFHPKILIIEPIYTLISYNFPFFLFSLIDQKFDILSFILNIISLISSLIYLEIIELNFCRLNKYIKANIIKRGYKEADQLLNEISLSSSENNDILNNREDII